LDDKALYFIEVKDFRGHRIENKDRLLKGKLPECQLIEGECHLIKGELPLAIELAQKVRDSVVCIIGAYHSSSFPAHWAPYAKFLCHKNKEIKVILWLERDLPSHPSLIKKTRAFLKANVFKQKLRWLTSQVRVESIDDQRLPDVKVSKLPSS
jgi:hypothetical protein